MMRNNINKTETIIKLIDNLNSININYEYLLNNLTKANDYLRDNIICGNSIDDEIIVNVIDDCNKIKDNIVNVENQCKIKLNNIQNGEDYG